VKIGTLAIARCYPEKLIIKRYVLLVQRPRWRGSIGTISVKFCTEVKRWLRYKMGKKYCWKF